MEKTSEIRNILLGRFVENEHGNLQMIPKGRFVIKLKGAYPGWQATFFFGVGKSVQTYEVARGKRNDAQIAVGRMLQKMGDSLELKETEGAKARLCNYRLSIPAVVAAEETKEGFAFTVFTGRSPMAWISRCRVFRKIGNLLPEYFVWQKMPGKEKLKMRFHERKERRGKRKQEKRAGKEKHGRLF